MPDSKAVGFLNHMEEQGEEAVRSALVTGEYGSPLPPVSWRAQAAMDFLDRKSKERQLLSASEALSTAKEANRIALELAMLARESAASARLQARWAMYAAIIAAVAAVAAAKDSIVEFISGLY